MTTMKKYLKIFYESLALTQIYHVLFGYQDEFNIVSNIGLEVLSQGREATDRAIRENPYKRW